MFAKVISLFVQRNLDNAQYAQPRGSQYEGPRIIDTPTATYLVGDDGWDEAVIEKSIHEEEVQLARVTNAHYDHFRLQGVLLEDCHLCVNIMSDPTHERNIWS